MEQKGSRDSGVIRPQEFYSLVGMLRDRAARYGDKRAYVFLSDGEDEGGYLTYGELDRRSRALAAQLQREVDPGRHALLLYPSGLEFITAFFGCLYAGVVAIPLAPPQLVKPNRSLARLRAIAQDADAKVVLTTTGVMRRANELIASVPELFGSHFLATDQLHSELAVQWEEPEVSGSTIAFLQYTSGSTSSPRGVVLTHGNILHNLAYISHCEQNTADSRSVSWLPVHHDMGLIEGILQPAFVGYTAHLMPPVAFLQRPHRWLQAISRYRATISGGPNFAYDLCTRKITPNQCGELDLQCWKVAYNGSEPVCARSMINFVNKFRPYGFSEQAFRPVYGLAEATLLVSSGQGDGAPGSLTVDALSLAQDEVRPLPSENERGITLVGCGPPYSHTRIAIVNPTTRKVCLQDQVGEIWVASESVAQAYWNRAEDTERNFQARLADGGEASFLRTGDLGFIRNGNLFVTGRIKDVIIIRGGKIYPQDIEHTIERIHPAICSSGAAAFSVPSETGERLVLLAELNRDHTRRNPLQPSFDTDNLFGDLREAIADQHEIHVSIIALLPTGALPRTTSGKLQRAVCRKAFLTGQFQSIAEWRETPRTQSSSSIPIDRK